MNEEVDVFAFGNLRRALEVCVAANVERLTGAGNSAATGEEANRHRTALEVGQGWDRCCLAGRLISVHHASSLSAFDRVTGWLPAASLG
jgi:hypothetical protein